MKFLFIAPIPPPTTGQSLAVKVIIDELKKSHHIEVVNLNKETLKSGSISFRRILQMFKIIAEVGRKCYKHELIYFTISESIVGNLKDIIIYTISFFCRKKTIIHMLGGAGMKRILEKKSLQNKLNRFFIQRLGGIIVEGNVQYNMFSKLISDDKIHIIPNFAEDYLFVDETEIEKKFCTMKPINVLYLSNLISGKGYNELVDAYINLNEELKKNIKIIFVGGFESEKDKRIFFNKIHPLKGVFYEGTFVSGIEKKLLYLRSHIFCLPSYYPFEGQPISILEAYATGCVVITTNHSGIPDIFTDGINGFEVEKMSSSSLSNVLQQIITNPQQLLPIATYNRRIAFEKYRTCIYLNSIKHVFNEIVSFKNINRKLI